MVIKPDRKGGMSNMQNIVNFSWEKGVRTCHGPKWLAANIAETDRPYLIYGHSGKQSLGAQEAHRSHPPPL